MTVYELISKFMDGTQTILITENNGLLYRGTIDNLFLKGGSFFLNANVLKIRAKHDHVVISIAHT